MPSRQTTSPPTLAVLGIRGLPAAHGGFESFVERLAPYLVERGWQVTVYCQEDGQGDIWLGQLAGVRLVHMPSGEDTPAASVRFDWASMSHVIANPPDVVLILGYNTACFAARLRLAGIPVVINMDGIEWKRAKWSRAAKAWLYLNERMGCWFGDHLIADHPTIAQHLRTRLSTDKVTTIPYGAEVLHEADGDAALLAPWGLEPRRYATLIARPEPENSVLEIVRAFSAQPRGIKLVVLGNYQPERNAYHAQVREAAGAEVVFLGAIYDSTAVHTLRLHSLFYVHGHQVGGTNPSLLEAMGAGNAVLAHDNPFNRWVAGAGAQYFADEKSGAALMTRVCAGDVDLASMGRANRHKVRDVFDWSLVLGAYAALLAAAASKGQAADASGQIEPIWNQPST